MYANESGDNKKIDELLIRLQSHISSHKSLSKRYYQEFFSNLAINIELEFKKKLRELTLSKETLFGLSAKYDSWISGYFLAKWIKDIYDTKVVIGGFENIHNSSAIFERFKIFDYAIYGIGEDSMLKLCNYHFKKNIELNKIPQLIYRMNNGIIKKNESIGTNTINNSFPKNYDYFQQIKNSIIEPGEISIFLEKSRGCRWNNCNFCALNWGFDFEEKNNEKVLEEIVYNYETYGITNFFFVDNDVIGKSYKVFNSLLESLIELSNKYGTIFEFHADLIHLGLDKNKIKKLSIAGFKTIQIGYEAITDGMLKKLNKCTTFADNILFLKFAKKYDISSFATGLIVGIPYENTNDILESTDNLHFLRFLLNDTRNARFKFIHNFAELVLFYNTNFWKMSKNEEISRYNTHPTADLLPENLIDFSDQYSVFGLTKDPDLKKLWDSFMEVSKYYETSNYSYYMLENGKSIHYYEYCNGLRINYIVFNELYWSILTIVNPKVISIKTLFNQIIKKFPNVTREQLKGIVTELKEGYFLYASKDWSKIVSVIDTDLLT